MSEACENDDCVHCDEANCECGCHAKTTVFDDEDDEDFLDSDDDSYWSDSGSDFD
jgi:hypothetical protein